jgi:hypothetical protein
MTAMTEQELLPCPFCAARAEFDNDDHGYMWVLCTGCGVTSDTERHYDEDARIRLAATWNRRAPTQPVAAPEPVYLVSVAPNEFYSKGNGWLEVDKEATWDRTDPARRRILYTAAPVQAATDEVRNRVLEEAAQAIDHYGDVNLEGEKLEAAIACMKIVRALKRTPADDSQPAVGAGGAA